jgi:hypothetical protein
MGAFSSLLGESDTNKSGKHLYTRKSRNLPNFRRKEPQLRQGTAALAPGWMSPLLDHFGTGKVGFLLHFDRS